MKTQKLDCSQQNINGIFEDYKERLLGSMEKSRKETESFLKKLQQEINKTIVNQSELIHLNVSGKKFVVSAETLLTPLPDPENENVPIPHFFSALCSTRCGLTKDKKGRLFINREPEVIPYILRHLRAKGKIKKCDLPEEGSKDWDLLAEECKFYSLKKLHDYLTNPFCCKRSIIKNEANKKKLFEITKHKNWKLIFKASRDGFESKDFHKHCDNINETLVIAVSDRGNLFGGFNSGVWDTREDYVRFDGSYIFSLKDSSRHEIVRNHKYSVHCCGKYGPIFGGGGGGHDLYISSNCHQNLISQSILGKNTYEGSGSLEGSTNFKVIDYEVFQKI